METAQRILTKPKDVNSKFRFMPTGNEYIALPTIDERTGGIYNFNVTMVNTRCLLEIGCDETKDNGYFVQPVIKVNDREQVLDEGMFEWRRINCWIPEFTYRSRLLDLKGTIFAPLNEKGFIYILRVTNNGEQSEFQLGIKGMIRQVNKLVFSRSRELGVKYAKLDEWTGNPLFIFKLYNNSIGFSLGCSEENNMDLQMDKNLMDTVHRSNYRFMNTFKLDKGEHKEICFYYSVNLEEDGSAVNLIHLKRRGYKAMYTRVNQWLQERICRLEDPILEKMLNENLFFNYFYAVGKALDSDEIVPMTSRSPMYYVSGAFWERDTLLWSLPSIIKIDRQRAREVLDYVLAKHSDGAGEHAHYIDGRIMYPGFELDQAAAYFIAVDRYVKETGDYSLMEDNRVLEKLTHVLSIIENRKDQATGLYSTFLLPSDDPAWYPLVIYDNVLVWKAFIIAADIYKAGKDYNLEKHFVDKAQSLKRSIFEYGIVHHKGRKMFAWSVDGKGSCRIYNDPPGSLLMLPYYGFIQQDDEIYRNTESYLYSCEYEYYFQHEPFKELACDHHPRYPSALGLCASLLSSRSREVLSFINDMEMDNGIFCESFDGTTGKVKTGAAFGTGAGFFAWALLEVWEKNTTL